jgi:hypothetical protein
MEQPGGVPGRLAGDSGQPTPQHPVLRTPKQSRGPPEVAGHRVDQLEGTQLVVQLPVRRRHRLEVFDRGRVYPGRPSQR